MKKTIHLVASTHWDREWYRTETEYRFYLLELLHDALGRLETGELPYFHLDGQASLLDDAVAASPSLRPRLVRAIREGQLEAGPWYILSDMLMPSGESYFRNLAFGRRAVEAFGGQPSSAVYAPDAFGHTGSLPAILNAAGFRRYFFCRGLGDQWPQPTAEFIWRSPEGRYALDCSCGVIDIFDPPGDAKNGRWIAGGYALAADLPTEREALGAYLRLLLDSFAPVDAGSHLLAVNGSDHLLPQRGMKGVLDLCRELTPEVEVAASRLEDYFTAAFGEARPRPALSGDLADGRFFLILAGTASARTPLKVANADGQSLLEGLVEPWLAAAPPEFREQYLPLQDLCWRQLLRNQGHDSLSCCGIDAMHAEMACRYEDVFRLGRALLARMARLDAGDRELPLLMPRAGEAFDVHILTPLASADPDTAMVWLDYPMGIDLDDYALEIAGRPVAFLVAESMPNADCNGCFVKSGPDFVMLRRARLALDMPLAPFASYPARFTPRAGAGADGALDPARGRAREIRRLLRGNFLSLEDRPDRGDEYWAVVDFAAPGAAASRPWRLTADAVAGSMERLAARTTVAGLPVDLVVTHKRGSPRYDFLLEFDNTKKDHHLSLVFRPPSPAAGTYMAEMPFGVETRELADPADTSSWREPRGRLRRHFGALAAGGLTVAAPGLHEHQIDGDALRVTLLRAVGALAGDRGGGPKYATPAAQLPGFHRFRFSVFLDGRGAEAGLLARRALAARRPAFAQTLGRGSPRAPASARPRLAADSAEALLSCCYFDPELGGVAVRLHNPSGRGGRANLTGELAQGSWARLSADRARFTPGDAADPRRIPIEPGEIVTLFQPSRRPPGAGGH